MDREDEVDARRLIRVRVIVDRWRRIDRFRVVVVTGLLIRSPAAVVTAFVIPLALIVIFAEGRRDGYTADHRGDNERHHDRADCRTKLPGSRVRGSHSDLPFSE